MCHNRVFVPSHKTGLVLVCAQCADIAGGTNRETSAIVSRCSRKARLCALIIDGKDELGPWSLYSEQLTPYSEIVTAALALDIPKLSSAIKNNQTSLINDQTLFLCKEIEEEAVRRQIRQLTKTYVTVTVGNVSRMTACKNAEQAQSIIADMIHRKELDASIWAEGNQPEDNVVSFKKKEGAQRDYEAHFTQELNEAKGLMSSLEQLDVELNCTEEYMKELVNNYRR
eukprot:gb/GECG01005941.1/.p1 GENE.gb/GECG01005941.1/~~gb/GECG01005941.1/.p1  ORF type:complete len:227 (+),score=32.89 gb/GECG01005941.1/:1-681(+)